MGQRKNVPGKVQIPMQSHSKLWNMGEHMSVPGNFPQRGDGRAFQERFKSRCNLTPYCGIWENTCQFREITRNGAMEERSGKGSNLDAISPPAKHGRSHVSSRKPPATGRWKIVPGKVRISMQISLPEVHGRCKVSSGKLPAAGRWRNVLGKVRIGGSHLICGILKLDRAGSRDVNASTL